ncbi:DUF4150 domain-containing protein, partial [Vibrio sp.]|nr:DUF4150 domain-containing protein [Vibrio sp.]
MGVSGSANNLGIVHQGSDGKALSSTPDVCFTKVGKPVKELPYDNSAQSSDLVDGSQTVKIDGGYSIALDGSKLSTSTGDEAGDHKGVVSGTIKGEAEFISSSPDILVEGRSVARHTDSLLMNNANTICFGIDNPGPEAEEQEVDKHDLHLSLKNRLSQPCANTPFKAIDKEGGVVYEGELDGGGHGVITDLDPVWLRFEFGEDPQAYQWFPRFMRKPNPRYTQHESSETVFREVAGAVPLFWELDTPKAKRNLDNGYWGHFRCQNKQANGDDMPDYYAARNDKHFQDYLRFELLTYFPRAIEAHEHNALARIITTHIDHDNDEIESADLNAYAAYLGALSSDDFQRFQLLHHVPTSMTYHRFLGILRARGTGNADEYMANAPWGDFQESIIAHSSELITLISERIDALHTFAEERNYKAMMQDLAHYRTRLTSFDRAVRRQITDVTAELKDKLQQMQRTPVDTVQGQGRYISSTTSSQQFQCYAEDFTPTIDIESTESIERPENTLRIGVFFDGTGQNAFNDKYKATKGNKAPTNMSDLFDAYPFELGKSHKIYVSGVGTIDLQEKFPDKTETELFALIEEGKDETAMSQALGVDADYLEWLMGTETGGFNKWQSLVQQLERLYLELSDKNLYRDISHIEFDVFGFSRGAALARHFINAIAEGFPDYTRPRSTQYRGQKHPHLLGNVEADNYDNSCGFERDVNRELSVRFVGLLDTVGSFYWPGNDDDGNFELPLKPGCAQRVVQLTAAHEYRKKFPLTSISHNGLTPDTFFEEVLPGAHSDIGGGYASKEQFYKEDLSPVFGQPASSTYNIKLILVDDYQEEFLRSSYPPQGQESFMHGKLNQIEPTWQQDCELRGIQGMVKIQGC